ncbi:hypothetical protein [Paenibacillus ginsengihumi]|uniref:hypothetical protein n=1 Tax=Paenibacillus ginsengihumi TaxID=431596 RepID=UPI0003666BE7|nr:hypothetical protein [Paenibacillus ginsengihumi]
MKYYFMLVGSIFMILFACLSAYFKWNPGVGPVGNGPDYDAIIWQLIKRLIISLAFLCLAIYYDSKEQEKKPMPNVDE